MMSNMIAPRADYRNMRMQSGTRSFRPMHCDIKEYEDRYELSLELPGFKKEEIKAEMKSGYLSITAEHPKAENESGRVIRSERYAGPYGRTFYVGDDIDESAVSAGYENGILSVTLRKIQKQPESTAIEIK